MSNALIANRSAFSEKTAVVFTRTDPGIEFGLFVLAEATGYVLQASVNYCNFANSDLASFRMGTPGSASFQSAKKSWYEVLALAESPDRA
jgi:hypothetical protein